MRKDHGKHRNSAPRGELALRLAAVVTVLAVVALGATGVQHHDQTAPVPAAAATPQEKPYYFPSEYQLKPPAEEPEQPATF